MLFRSLDVGCAEGYYAVGLALRCPAAHVYAYDTDPAALQACRDMARLNGVLERITLGAELTAHSLQAFPFAQRALIVCDCEGCEGEIFSDEAIQNLARCDLVVELHTFIDPAIPTLLSERFRRTHTIDSVRTRRRRASDFLELAQLPPLAREVALAESRPGPMEWLVLEPRDR